MGKPSEKALRTALLATEHAGPHSPGMDTGASGLVALAQALKERIGVLQILDGTAPEWPGIQACVDSVVDLSHETLQQLQASRDDQERATASVRSKEGEIQQLRGQLAESADALAAAEDEATQTLEAHREATEQLQACRESMEQQRVHHERKSDELRERLGKAERTVAELETECKQHKHNLEFQEAEMASLKQTVAQQLDELVEHREDLAAKGADLERQTQLAARHSAEVTLSRRKLQDSAAALAEARSAAAVLRTGAEHSAAALRREQEEVAGLRTALRAARQDAERSKHLRDAHATASLDKLQERDAEAAERQRALEAQLAQHAAASAALEAEVKAATALAAERAKALQAQQRSAQLQQQELADAKLRAREQQAEGDKLRKSLAELQAAHQALGSKADRSAQQAQAAEDSRQVLDDRIRGECRAEQQQLRQQLKAAEQDLAIKASLADSWHREVAALCKRLEQADADKAQLQGLNRMLSKQLADATTPKAAPADASHRPSATAPAPPHAQGGIDELRTELRAFASHLTAQQLGALAHISAARGHTFPGGPRGHQSPTIDWTPALWGADSAALPAPPRRRKQLARVPQSTQDPCAGEQPGAISKHVDWAPQLHARESGSAAAPASASDAQPVPSAATDSLRAGSAPQGHDMTRAAAARHARRRTAPAGDPPITARRNHPARGSGRPSKRDSIGDRGGAASGSLKEVRPPCDSRAPFRVQNRPGGGHQRPGRSPVRTGSRESLRSVSEQERALEQELERMKQRLAARVAAGGLPGKQEQAGMPGGMAKPARGVATAHVGKKFVTVPSVW